MVAVIPTCKQAKSGDTLHCSGRRAFALNAQGKRPSSPPHPHSAALHARWLRQDSSGKGYTSSTLLTGASLSGSYVSFTGTSG